MKIRATIELDLRKATGPNPKNKRYELVDSDGVRMDYVDDVQQAIDTVDSIISDAVMPPSKIEAVGEHPGTTPTPGTGGGA